MKFDITNVDMDIQLEAKGMTAHVEIVQGKAWLTNVQLFLADHPYDAIWIQDDPIEIPNASSVEAAVTFGLQQLEDLVRTLLGDLGTVATLVANDTVNDFLLIHRNDERRWWNTPSSRKETVDMFDRDDDDPCEDCQTPGDACVFCAFNKEATNGKESQACSD